MLKIKKKKYIYL